MNNGVISGWVEGILLSLLMLSVFTLIVVNMNLDYSKNYEIGLTDNTTEKLFITYMDTSKSNVESGTVEYDSENGITLKESYNLALSAIKVIWNFLTGGWIYNIVNKLNLGDAGNYLARTVQILYFLSVVFAVLFALFKIKM
jgi:hypothetical protein